MADRLDIGGSLRGQHVFLTGGTGFVGKVLIEKILWSLPEIGGITVLVRPDAECSAAERFAAEVLDSPLMARCRALHGTRWQAWVETKVDVVEGDLGAQRLGLDAVTYRRLCRRIDRIVACAATVTFDERLDRALDWNILGAQRMVALARDAGAVPLVHVSTCFVSGSRRGVIEEHPVELQGEHGAVDLDTVLDDLATVCRRLRDDPAADEARWVAAGVQQAQRYGFHDVYTLSKALAELVVARDGASVPTAIVRPAIIESAVEQPIAGWIESVRVSDPLIVAYGRGRIRELPGTEDGLVEWVPVDHVANAVLAVLADLPASTSRAVAEPPRIFQISSSRHPLTLGRLMAYARDGFVAAPWPDADGEAIAVEPAEFVEPERLQDQLAGRQRRCRTMARLAGTVGAANAAARWTVAGRGAEHFSRLIDVYRPYLDHGARYSDAALVGLWHRVSAEDQAVFPFDVATIDWPAYIAGTHVPGLLRFALAADGGGPPATDPAMDRPIRWAQRRAAAEQRAERAATVFDVFASTARAHPTTIAFQTCRQGRWLRYSYGQALTTTANLAWRLATEHGVEVGDRVVLWSSGCPEWVLTALAVHRLGATIVPLDPQWPASEVEAAAHLVAAKLVCAAPHLAAAWPATESLPVVPLADPWVPSPDVELLPAASEIETCGGADDLASILFTSGTTVAPKAVPLTHANLLANLRDLVPLMRLSHDRLLSVLPIHHAFEQMVGWLVPMAGASTISYVAKLEPAEINWMMVTTRPTVLVAVPRLLELLHAGIERSVEAGGPMLRGLFGVLFALSRLTGARYGHRLFAKVHRRFGGSLRRIATGGSALDPRLGRRFRWLGFQVAEGYGLTETSPVLTVNPWHAIRLGSAGRPLPGVDVALRPIANPGGMAGEGEVWVRGANVMAGYFQNANATAEVMDDGWFNTGDIGSFDGEGYLHLSGRSKDVIVTAAGKNVYPEEVEARYQGVLGVEELVILGLPRSAPDGEALAGEQVTALVVPAAGADASAIDSVQAAIDARAAEIPSYQRVTRVEVWHGELPKTTTMKVRRSALRDAVLAGERGAGSTSSVPPKPASRGPALSGPETWVVETLARLVRQSPGHLDADDRLADLGVDSLCLVELVGAIEARFGRRYDSTTVASLHRVRDLFALI